MTTRPTVLLRNLRNAVVLGTLLAFGSSSFAQDLAPPTRGRPIDSSGPVDVEAIAQRADSIAHGVITNARTRWIGRSIYTEYDLIVQETLKGPARSRITVALPGGTIGNVELAVPGRLQLVDGDEIVFFGQRFDSQLSFVPVGILDGIVAVSKGRGAGTTVAPRGKPEDLGEFLDEVRKLARKR